MHNLFYRQQKFNRGCYVWIVQAISIKHNVKIWIEGTMYEFYKQYLSCIMCYGDNLSWSCSLLNLCVYHINVQYMTTHVFVYHWWLNVFTFINMKLTKMVNFCKNISRRLTMFRHFHSFIKFWGHWRANAITHIEVVCPGNRKACMALSSHVTVCFTGLLNGWTGRILGAENEYSLAGLEITGGFRGP